MKKKIIQVPMPEELVQKLDVIASEKGESRAAFIREACAEYIASSLKAELIRQDVEGYIRVPESEADSEWRRRKAAEIWGEEDWNEEDI